MALTSILPGYLNMPESSKTRLAQVTSSPGVYLMKDADGQIIYVGKARNLKKRLASYFKQADHPDMKTEVLVRNIESFETIITGSEKEALILEANLIKRHRPRYNVILKDDKRYPSLRLDPREEYPNLTIVRKVDSDGALYFGPYTSAGAVRQTLKIINKTFKLRKCRAKDIKKRTRPCLFCQMQGCLAPCCLDVNREHYHDIVKEVVLFLKGRTPELIRKIRNQMTVAAEAQDFEIAASLRDKMYALEKTLEKQVAVTTDFMDRDVLAIARSPVMSLIMVLFIRGGFLIGTRHFSVTDTLASETEMIGTFIRQHYENSPFLPKEIIVPVRPEAESALEEWLSEIKEQKVHILKPLRGEKSRLLDIAKRNAVNTLKELSGRADQEEDILRRLGRKLGLTATPVRIECFDNSNLQGNEPVSSMVVFEKGKPEKSQYRRYKIKTVSQPDDYASMGEVLRRRYGKEDDSRPFPDILMVDGGKGQLNIAVSVLQELGIDDEFTVLGIAKKDESRGDTQDKIYLPGRANPVIWGRDVDVLLFLQRIRDESHRFAINFHRKRRRMTFVRSSLDSVPGIGKRRKAVLLKHFGSIEKIREASIEELAGLPGMNRRVAESVRLALSELPLH